MGFVDERWEHHQQLLLELGAASSSLTSFCQSRACGVDQQWWCISFFRSAWSIHDLCELCSGLPIQCCSLPENLHTANLWLCRTLGGRNGWDRFERLTRVCVCPPQLVVWTERCVLFYTRQDIDVLRAQITFQNKTPWCTGAPWCSGEHAVWKLEGPVWNRCWVDRWGTGLWRTASVGGGDLVCCFLQEYEKVRTVNGNNQNRRTKLMMKF